jgi:hypothetical protein
MPKGRNKKRSSRRTKNTKTIFFTADGLTGKSAIRLVDLGVFKIEDKDKIKDEELSSFEIEDTVKGNIFRCRMSHVFFMSHTTIPLYYLTVACFQPPYIYKSYSIWVNFEIENPAQYKSYDQMINADIPGKFTSEIMIEEDKVPLDLGLETFPGQDIVVGALKKYAYSEDMIEMSRELINKFKKEKCKDFNFVFKPPTATVKCDVPSDDEKDD